MEPGFPVVPMVPWELNPSPVVSLVPWELSRVAHSSQGTKEAQPFPHSSPGNYGQTGRALIVPVEL